LYKALNKSFSIEHLVRWATEVGHLKFLQQTQKQSDSLLFFWRAARGYWLHAVMIAEGAMQAVAGRRWLEIVRGVKRQVGVQRVAPILVERAPEAWEAVAVQAAKAVRRVVEANSRSRS